MATTAIERLLAAVDDPADAERLDDDETVTVPAGDLRRLLAVAVTRQALEEHLAEGPGVDDDAGLTAWNVRFAELEQAADIAIDAAMTPDA